MTIADAWFKGPAREDDEGLPMPDDGLHIDRGSWVEGEVPEKAEPAAEARS